MHALTLLPGNPVPRGIAAPNVKILYLLTLARALLTLSGGEVWVTLMLRGNPVGAPQLMLRGRLERSK